MVSTLDLVPVRGCDAMALGRGTGVNKSSHRVVPLFCPCPLQHPFRTPPLRVNTFLVDSDLCDVV
jgi:hypothetical protein